MDNQDQYNKGPADVLRDGALKATIWENDGEKGRYYNTTLAKTFEDRSGNLRDTHSFSNHEQLLKLAKIRWRLEEKIYLLFN